MRAFVLDGYGAIADHVRLAEIADPVAGPGRRRDRNPCRQPQSDRLQDRAWRPEARLEISACRARSGSMPAVSCCRPARGPPDSSRAMRSMRARRATPSAHLPSRSRCRRSSWRSSRRPLPHAEAAALPLVGLTTLQGLGASGAEAGQRILIHAGAGGDRHLRGSIRKASRPSRHHDHEFEECRLRRIARAPTGSLPMTAKTISNRVAITISSTTRSAAHSRSMPSRW